MDFIPITANNKDKMLKFLGVETIDELFTQSIPHEVKQKKQLNIPAGVSEYELIKHMRELAERNLSLSRFTSFLGGGAYDHFIPSIVDAIVSLPELYTPYTPYQPEVSQGILQSIFEYQTMIIELTGLEVANASLYDGSTAVSEASLLACDVTGKNKIVVSETVHPEYREVLKNYTVGIGAEIKHIPMKDGLTDLKVLEEMLSDDCACVIIQHPNFFGYLEDVEEISIMAHRYKALFIVCIDPISLAILKAPGEYNADVAVGEGQPLGNKMNFGGPYLGIFACRREYIRRVPGHLISSTTDKNGRVGYVLTLQAREQYIRREKATSNICTSEVLNAIAAAVYLSYMGPEGLLEVANQCLQKSHYAYKRLSNIHYLEPLSNAPFFKEFCFKSSKPIDKINDALLDEGIIGGLDIGKLCSKQENTILFCVTEKRTKDEIDKLVSVMEKV
ncbi:MAG: aminomethyl-transferring glycine dehydrogenase subunit GcvPA [Actinomycetota bacterium]